MRHYPEHLLLPHKAARWRGDYYTFSPAAAHLLSLVSGVERDKIERAKIYGRSIRRPFPWYGRKSYGGITMPAGDGYAITFTGNLFDPDRLGRNYYAWLNIASHEVGHINHIDESNRAADAKYRKLLEAALYSSVPVISPALYTGWGLILPNSHNPISLRAGMTLRRWRRRRREGPSYLVISTNSSAADMAPVLLQLCSDRTRRTNTR